MSFSVEYLQLIFGNFQVQLLKFTIWVAGRLIAISFISGIFWKFTNLVIS